MKCKGEISLRSKRNGFEIGKQGKRYDSDRRGGGEIGRGVEDWTAIIARSN
jgi:hypothetical protein